MSPTSTHPKMDKRKNCATHSDPTDQAAIPAEHTPRCPFLYYIFLWDRQANPMLPCRREALQHMLQTFLPADKNRGCIPNENTVQSKKQN